MSDTKEKILQVSLELFSTDGYEAVSVSAIASRLGITKGALYRHYSSKRDIFDSILSRMEQRDAEQADTYDLPVGTLQEMEPAYRRSSLCQLLRFCVAQFRYWTEDPFAANFRRMLTLEQYRSPEMGALYQQYLGAGPMGYTKDLLESWGLDRPEEKAAALYGQMFLLYSVSDAAQDKQAVRELLERCVGAAAEGWAAAGTDETGEHRSVHPFEVSSP